MIEEILRKAGKYLLAFDDPNCAACSTMKNRRYHRGRSGSQAESSALKLSTADEPWAQPIAIDCYHADKNQDQNNKVACRQRRIPADA